MTSKGTADMATVPEPKLVIYRVSCACHPEAGVRYVGQTRRGLTSRKYEHKHSALKQTTKNTPLNAWMRKHGWENLVFDIIEALASAKDLDEREIFWIGFYGTSLADGGLNHAPGGGVYLGPSTTAGRTRSEETKLRIGQSNKSLPDETVAEIRTRRAGGERQRALAREFNVSEAAISSLVNRKSYRWVA
jgi:group I intron endonuclease